MAIYFVLLFTNSLFGFISHKLQNGKKVYFWVTVIQLTLVAGLRASTVGTDTQAYINMFDKISQLNTIQDLWNFREEFGYVLLNKTIFLIGGSYNLLFTICGFITAYGLMKYLYDNTNDFNFATYLFITFMFFFTSMNTIRHYMAIAIGINALTYLKKNRYIISILLLVISLFFHKLAALMFVLPILNYLKSEKWFDVLFFVLCIIAVLFCKEILMFFASLANYQNYIINAKKTNAIFYIVMFVAIFAFVLLSEIIGYKVIKNNKMEFYCLCICLVLSIIARTFFEYANRLTWSFSMPIIVLMTKYFDTFTLTDKKIMKLIIIPIMFMFFVYALYVMNWQGIAPYKFFWQ